MLIHSSLLAVALVPLVQAFVANPACCTDTVPASTHTITVTATAGTSATVTSGTQSTSFKFLSGNPPASSALAKKREASLEVDERAVNGILPRNGCNADNCLRALRGHTGAPFCATYTQTKNTATTGLPTYIPSACNPSRISSACSCLSTVAPIPTVTSYSSTTTTTTSTTTSSCSCPPISIPAITITTTATGTTTVSPAPTTRTIYPCADPLPSPGPAYGDYASHSDLGLQNTLYYLDTPQGASARTCCNACFFEIPNCVQAYFYSYEGCVVSQATNLSSADGTGVSSVCPAGVFGGLTYGPDVSPASKSTGNIAGPCGVAYANL